MTPPSWQLPPCEYPGRTAAFSRRDQRVVLIINLVEMVADLGRSDLRNLREWLETTERDIDETPRSPGGTTG